MTDELTEMAKLAGWEMDDSCVLSPQVLWYIYQKQLETFAELIKQKERERIANQIDRMPFGDTAASFAVWIREGAK